MTEVNHAAVQPAAEPRNWRTTTFGNSAALVRDSVAPSDCEDTHYIGLEHIGEGTLSLLGVGLAGSVSSVKSRFRSGDILFGKLRPYFRKVIRARFEGICSTDIWVVRPAKGVDARYLFYVMASQGFVDAAMQGSEGTRMPRAQWGHVSRIKLQVPPIAEQRAIADVLGTLDDKIEQNRQTAAALERLARAIFRAWFVDFAPVHAKAAGAASFPSMPQHVFDALPTSFVDSEIGPVPEGWYSGPLGDVIDIHDSRRVPLSRREREKRKGSFRYYGATGIIDYVNGFLFDGPFVLVGEDGTVVNDQDTPITQYVWGRFWVNNHAHVLTGSSSISTEYLRVLLDHINIRPFVTGAVQPKLSQRNLKSVPILSPPPEAVAVFDDIIAPLFAWLRQAHDQSRELASMRDLLLPELLTGSVRVGVADG